MLSKLGDRNSQELFVATSNGRPFRSALLEVADEDTGIPRFRMSFTDVLITSIQPESQRRPPAIPRRPNVSGSTSRNVEYNYNPVPEPDALDLLQSIFKSLGLAAANDSRTSRFSEIVVSKSVDDSSTELFEDRGKNFGRR